MGNLDLITQRNQDTNSNLVDIQTQNENILDVPLRGPGSNQANLNLKTTKRDITKENPDNITELRDAIEYYTLTGVVPKQFKLDIQVPSGDMPEGGTYMSKKLEYMPEIVQETARRIKESGLSEGEWKRRYGSLEEINPEDYPSALRKEVLSEGGKAYTTTRTPILANFGEAYTSISNALYQDGVDILGNDEFIMKNYVGMPKYLQNSFRVVANGADEYIIKPILTLGGTAVVGAVKGGMEGVEMMTEGLTKAVQDGLTEDSNVYKFLDKFGVAFTGKDVIPFSPTTSGKKMSSDLIGMVESTEGGLAAKIAGMQSVKALLKKPEKDLNNYLHEKYLAELEIEEGLNIYKVKGINNAVESARKAQAAKVAAKNQDIAESLIDEFEEHLKDSGYLNTSISKVVAGKKFIDYEKAREVSKEALEMPPEERLTNQILYSETKTPSGIINKIDVEEGVQGLNVSADNLVSPILNPDKFNKIIAIAAELKSKNKDAFKEGKVIDNMFKLTVEKKLLADDELMELLAKYNISYEDYILMVVGSGSKAGKVLNKLSQLKRVRPMSQARDLAEKKAREMDGKIGATFKRMDNIRRGGLVGTIATAMRNLYSGMIRNPSEGFVNLFETIALRIADGEYQKAARTVFTERDWQDSFRHLKYMFDDQNRAEAFTNFILENPEFDDQINRFYNQVNEIRLGQGKGQFESSVGKKFDAVLTGLEDVVDVLNAPNRLQEFVMRRAVFMGELQRLLRREWGMDLHEALKNGKMRDIINDAPNLKPKDSRSILEIVDDSVRKSLELTYAASPRTKLGRSIVSAINNIPGGTLAIAFPRFMVSSMELLGQYAAGSGAAVINRMVLGNKTNYNATMVSRNIVGLVTAGAAYQYRESLYAPAEYFKMKVGKSLLDVTANFPMAQFLWVGEAIKQQRKGTFDIWFKSQGGFRGAAKVFTGTNFRPGMFGGDILFGLHKLFTSSNALDEKEGAKLVGQSLGNLATTYFQPFTMAVDLQRGLGLRTSVKRETDVAGGGFKDGFFRPFKARGLISPSDEEQLLKKVSPMEEGDIMRKGSLLRLFGGMTLYNLDSPQKDFLIRLGFDDYQLSGKTASPEVNVIINDILNDVLPMEVNKLMEEQKKMRKEGKSERFITLRLRTILKQNIAKHKIRIAKSKSDLLGLVKKPIDMSDEEFNRSLFSTSQLMQWDSLPKDRHDLAVETFKDIYKRFPDSTNIEDMQQLINIAKRPIQ